MKTPEEMAKEWESIIPSIDKDRVTLIFQHIKDKYLLEIEELRQLNDMGISLMSGLGGLLGKHLPEVFAMIKDNVVNYSTVYDALNLEYNKIINGEYRK